MKNETSKYILMRRCLECFAIQEIIERRCTQCNKLFTSEATNEEKESANLKLIKLKEKYQEEELK